MQQPDFIVHDAKDSVGVVVVESFSSDLKLNGWVLETDGDLSLIAQSEIPLGHKVALRAIKQGDEVIKYGHSIGRAIADIAAGEHVHVHNVKTNRW